MGRKSIDKERKENPETRKKWIEQLIPVYLKNGLKKFNMDEIATTLNVSKATLYKHFSSREALLQYALDYKLEQIGSFQTDLFNDALPFLDRYLSAIHIFYHEISDISNEFLTDLKHLHPKLWKRVEFFRNMAGNVLKEFYQKGIEEQYFNNIEPAILVINDKLFFEAISDPDFLNEHQLSLQQAFRSYFELRINGLFANNKHQKAMQKKVAEVYG
jgi:AcrR family transcriptional regulator